MACSTDLRALTDYLTTEQLGQPCEIYDEIDSTNAKAQQLLAAGAKSGTLVIADVQTAGRGRRGRKWISRSGSGIWMSLLLRPEISPANSSRLTIVAALAAARTLAQMGIGAQIKWPNDIIIQGRKNCGILTEMIPEDSSFSIIVGIGINVNRQAVPPEIADIAVSLEEIVGAEIPRAKLAAEVINQFEPLYRQFLKTENLRFCAEEYNRLLVNRGQRVRVLDPAGAYPAVADGIDETGALHVFPEGETTERIILSGEVSVRGVLGYV